ncbi:MAG: AAA domain-containing protein [Kofleriaceae bacterium]
MAGRAAWPTWRLGTHYRSQHPSLISFAARRYYDDALALWPAPAHAATGLGLRWVAAPGTIDAVARTHAGEADAVMAEVEAHLGSAQRRARSLAILVDGPAQRRLIEARLAELARRRPELAALLSSELPEPVLVRELDGAQGEVRDVVLLACGIGPDEHGAIPREVGSLGQPGGERRLLVATTRARQELVLVSACAPEAIAGEAATHGAAGLGVRHLTELMVRARDGGDALVAADLGPTDPVLLDVAAALAELGLQTRSRGGDGLARIGLAVVDADDPSRDVLAIDTDGPELAAIPSALERDLARPAVLASLGWRTHRIWVIDWLADRPREVARLQAAVGAAQAAARTSRRSIGQGVNHAAAVLGTPERGGAAHREPRQRPDPAPVGGAGRAGARRRHRAAGGAAVDADAKPPRQRRPRAPRPACRRSAPTWRRRRRSVGAPRRSVPRQARRGGRPPHRAGARDRGAHPLRPCSAGGSAATSASAGSHHGGRAGAHGWRGRAGQLADDGEGSWRADQIHCCCRLARRRMAGANTKRTIDEVPLAELASAALIVVTRSGGAGAVVDVARDAARLLGFARITERVVERAAQGVGDLVERGLLARDGQRVVRTSA